MENNNPTIYLAADHWGFELIPQLSQILTEQIGLTVEHCGPFEYDAADDYPDFIKRAAAAVAADPENRRAVIFGKSGQGEAMCANRFPGVRAAVYYGGPEEIITLSREHNNANVLSLGAGFLSLEEIVEVIALWLNTPFTEEERHARRIKKLDDLVVPE